MAELLHVKDIVYPVFYAIEEEMRRHIHRLSPQKPTLDVKMLHDLLTKTKMSYSIGPWHRWNLTMMRML